MHIFYNFRLKKSMEKSAKYVPGLSQSLDGVQVLGCVLRRRKYVRLVVN